MAINLNQIPLPEMDYRVPPSVWVYTTGGPKRLIVLDKSYWELQRMRKDPEAFCASLPSLINDNRPV